MSGRGSLGVGMFTPPTPRRSRSNISTPPARKREERKTRHTTTASTPSPPPSTTTITTTTCQPTSTITTAAVTSTTTTTTTTTPSATVSDTTTIKTTATSTNVIHPTTSTVTATTITITITTTASSTNTTSSSSPSRGHATSSHQLSPWAGSPSLTSSSSGKKNCTSPDSRLVVLGHPAVGKSALVVRFLTGRFIWEYDPTLEAVYRHHTLVDDEVAVMDILDTAGEVSHIKQGDGPVREGLARWGEGFLLVFSVTDRASFSFLQPLHAALATARTTPNFPCVVVANKTDLGHITSVSEEEAVTLARELGASLFFTSASDGGPSIQSAFSEVHRDVVRRRWTRRRRSSAKTVIEGFYKMFSR